MKHASIVFVAMGFVNIANFGFHYGAVRLLGIPSYGALAVLFAMVFVLSVPATVLQAVAAATIGELSLRHANEEELLRVGYAMLRVIAMIAVAAAVVGVAASPFIGAYLHIVDVPAVMLAWSAVALGLVVALLRGLMQGVERFRAFAVSLGLEAGGNVCIGLPLLAAHQGIAGAMIANNLAVLAALLHALYVLRRGTGPGHISLDVRRIVAKCGGTGIGLVTLAAMAWSDLVLVRHFAPASLSGAYGALSIVGKMVLFSVSFLPMVLLPKIARMSDRSGDGRPLLMKTLAAGCAMCAIELTILVALPGNVMVAVAGREAASSAPYLPFYAGALSALGLTTIIVHYNLGRHRFGFVAPLVFVEIAEIVAICQRHDSLFDVVTIVLIGHSCALVGTALVTWAQGARSVVFSQQTAPGA